MKRMRLWLAHRIYPHWQRVELEAAAWRAHKQRHRLGLVRCSDDHAGTDKWEGGLIREYLSEEGGGQ